MLPKIAAAALAVGFTASAEAVPCDGDAVSVVVGGGIEAPALCAMLDRLQSRLEACNLPRPGQLEVRVRDAPFEDDTRCMGQFDCDRHTIEVLAPGALAGVLSPDSAYRGVPPDGLFEAILMHELAHAHTEAATTGQPPSLVRDEYIAYALQLDSLDEGSRAAFLSRVEIPARVGEEDLSAVMVHFAPALFAARAWTYFAAPDHGCAQIPDILAGRVSFGGRPF